MKVQYKELMSTKILKAIQEASRMGRVIESIELNNEEAEDFRQELNRLLPIQMAFPCEYQGITVTREGM